MGRLRAVALLLVVISAAVESSSAANSPNGSFHFGKVQFEPKDILAFRVDTKDPKKPMTVVALTNFKIDRAAVMEAIDTGSALVGQAAAMESGGDVVFVRLVAPDRCGVAGFLGQTQQEIDVGESFPAKTTTSSDSRIAGQCATKQPGKMFDDTYEFRLPYDVAITTIPKPSALAAGGGEPGVAYTALLRAIQAADWDAAHLHLRAEEVPATRPKAADMKNYFHDVALNYPKTATVSGGLIKGDRANLDFRGTDHDGKKIRGVVAMKKISGQWRVLDQNMFFAE